MKLTRVLLVAASVLLFGILQGAPPVSAQGTFEGEIPSELSPGGVALVVWSGGPLAEMETAAGSRGCDITSVWATEDGGLVGYIVGAPEFANTSWTALVGVDDVEQGPYLLVCRTPGLDRCQISVTSLDSVGVGEETPLEALELGLESLGELPEGELEEVSATASESNWELVSHDGVVVGTFVVVRDEQGWRLDRLELCAFE